MSHELMNVPGLRLVDFEGLVALKLSRPLVMHELRLVSDALTEAMKTSPNFAMLSVLAEGVRPGSDPKEREETLEITKKFFNALTASAVVMQGKGLGFAMVRLFMAGYSLYLGKPLRLFLTIEDAVAWLKTLPNQPQNIATLDPLEVVRTLEQPR